ncbi:MAG: YqgE/AlgH family protein [Sphingomonadales bacterium]
MSKSGFLTGQFLMAMPSIGDDRFDRTLIYMCAHSSDRAMGIVINKVHSDLDFEGLLAQLDIEVDDVARDVAVHAGGPVEPGRGFVLHSADYVQDSSLVVSETVALTATVDILKELATGRGPRNAMLALGYAGWSSGQLENELSNNAWLTAASDDEILFNTDAEQKYPRTMAMLGIDLSMLSSEAGHA